MPCKTCETPSGLQTCLFCGHAFCGVHRTERDGAVACTACNEQEHGRRKAASERARVAAAGPRPPSGRQDEGIGTAVEGGPALPPPPPLPVPDAGWTPLLVAGCVAALAGAYLWALLGWALADQADLPGWLRHAGTAAGSAFVLGGVWIIVKSKLT